MRWVAVALALQLRAVSDSSPEDVITKCRNDLKEVEATVEEAISKVHQAKDAVAAEQQAVKEAREEHADVSQDLEERQAKLLEEQRSLSRLEVAVHEFAKGLEARRAALSLARERLEEKEALRNAYQTVVATSEQTLSDLEKEPLVEDTSDAALVRDQHLEMKRAALAEEQERLKTVDHEVQVEIDSLEEEVTVWQADRDRHAVFKSSLEDKQGNVDILQKAAAALEKKVSALEELVGTTGDKVLGVSKAMGASEESLHDALHDLIRKQGAAVDLLEQSIKRCMEDSESQVEASAATESKLEDKVAKTETEVAETEAEVKEAEAATVVAKAEGAVQVEAAEKALEKEKATPPTHTEALKVVKDKVRASLADSIKEFVDQLDDVDGADALKKAAEAEALKPKADEKAEAKEAKPTADDFHAKLGDLIKQLPS